MVRRKKRLLSAALVLAMALTLFAGIPLTAGAANAESLKATIEGFAHGGVGEPLTATVSGSTVTVTGSVTGATNRLTLNIDDGTTVRWQASYRGATSATASNLIYLEGPGTFDVAAGGAIVDAGPRNAVWVRAPGSDFRVSGGEVSATGTSGAIYSTGNNTSITISDGAVSAAEGNAIYSMGNDTNINISGGTVSAVEGNAIYSMGNDTNITISDGTVSGGTVEARIYAIEARGDDTVIVVSGGAVFARRAAINTCGDHAIVEVSGGSVSRAGANLTGGAIEAYGANSAVRVSGGTVSSTLSAAICTSEISSTVELSGGFIFGTSIASVDYDDPGTSELSSGGSIANGAGARAARLTAWVQPVIHIVDGGQSPVISGDAVVCEWLRDMPMPTSIDEYSYKSQAAPARWRNTGGMETYIEGTSTDLTVLPDWATVVWGRDGGQTGVYYANGANEGFLPVDGVIVEPPPEPTPTPTPTPTLLPFPFTDVADGVWYRNAVEDAWRMGLIDGKTPTLYMPEDNLTYAEAVKLAACMHQLYTAGAVTLSNATGGNPWYMTYVDYAKDNGIIDHDYEWSAPATRAGYIEIFANALPDDALPPMNAVSNGAIQDVPMTHPQAAAIYRLYRAGILTGVDAAHNCNPDANIMRSEVATILVRMMDPAERVSFSIET